MGEPIKSFRHGCCSASVFVNIRKISGVDVKMKDIVLQRNYKDRAGKWQGTNSFSVNELPKVLVAAQKAYDFITASTNNNEQNSTMN